ncbi:MAG: bifunctional aspartate kinase/homoserine dehydrogenase I, partial [Chitinophagaceae bacterium]|nr:bifunctional aspartate kinase/homoserine dehydrogenase I [Chitinophagaceae bacterium]
MRVLKFGGTSVANAENIKKVVQIVSQNNYPEQIVVCSAMSGVTDQLIQAGNEASLEKENYKNIIHSLTAQHLDAVKALLPVTNQSTCLSMVMQQFNELEDICDSVCRLQELSPAVKDRIASFGELLSCKIVSAYLSSLNLPHEWLDSRDLITTNSNYGHAAVDFSATNEKIKAAITTSTPHLFIAPGFVARNHNGQLTTLGRGGSDYTAAIYAAALDAEALEIWTDVSGMMTADPRWVSNAKPIPKISYKEAMELSHFGAKVVYPPTIQPVMRKNIPVWVKNTFAPNDEGTLIDAHVLHTGEDVVAGISGITQISLLSLEGSGMVGIPGFSKTLFGALAAAEVNVVLITQSSSEHSICVAINDADVEKAKHAVSKAFEQEINTGILEPIQVEKDLSIIALVGDKMKSHPGISGKMFNALGRNGINVRAIAQGSSEKNISAVISVSDVKKGVNVLHEEFFESVYKQVNVFVVGTGNVGSRLLEQLNHQREYLRDQMQLQVQVMGIINSKKMLFSNNGGIDLNQWRQLLQEKGEPNNAEAFVNTIITKNLRNSVVVDVTANEHVAETYSRFLTKSISVVACNKIACASPYKNYRELKSLSKAFNASFFYETNVGASLPVIGTLNDLLRSGDEIIKIQAVLSGTLNFVFNNYNGTRPFAEVVKQAQDEGYTEPDPRLDL